ncbi:Hypothetical protein R9X50_00742700 [Acrodontium crateriforme]|uniref:Uncharacterized protein n=1 Tax=Acrodontium crateriforme TaxID=150365 RepID=A0AAQ3MBC7_9PEZI|nr:Hypothetical protein R9X50_00742700 [Acrodontium crateriforme]
MFPALQPTRPKTSHPSNPNPGYQQQTRTSHSDLHTTQPASTPRNQIEAMPPNQSPAREIRHVAPNQPLYNPAMIHPVFHSETWHRPPFAVPTTAGFSPIATGYVFGNGKIKASSTKL